MTGLKGSRNLFSENLNVSRGYIAGNSLNLAVTVVVGFVGNNALFPYDVIDFAILSAHRFWRETVSLLDVM